MDKLNPILNADSYKLGHFLQYPEGIQAVSGYITTRGTAHKAEIVFFGLQMFLKEYLARPISRADIEEAADIAGLHGQPFDRAGWEHILNAHGGHFPLRIEALPEGMLVRRDLPLLQVVNTDPKVAWLTGFMETALLRAVWYPSTVASHSRRLKHTLQPFYETSCDHAEVLMPSVLADYGARAVTSREQAGLGGLAHLLHFDRTDTLAAIQFARSYYGAAMAGFSMPASEHTTMIAWGADREAQAFAAMMDKFASFDAYSVVSDSFDLSNAIAEIWGKQLHDKVLASGARLVIRPDSGDPIDTPVQVVAQLAYAFGTHLNGKGFKVINHGIRVLQADAVSSQDMTMILGRLEGMGFSAENIAFGMGSSLLQKVSRDTYGFTMRCTACQDASGQWRDIARRSPNIREPFPKTGRRAVVEEAGDIFDVHLGELAGRRNLLRPVWENGELLQEWTFDEIRTRARA